MTMSLSLLTALFLLGLFISKSLISVRLWTPIPNVWHLNSTSPRDPVQQVVEDVSTRHLAMELALRLLAGANAWETQMLLGPLGKGGMIHQV